MLLQTYNWCGTVLIQILIAHGADINGTFGSLNTTVLMTSSFHGYSHIVHHLLVEGADVKLVDNQGSTALGYAFGGFDFAA